MLTLRAGTVVHLKGMLFVRHYGKVPRLLWKSALFAAAAAQFVLALAPFAEGQYGTSARAHVEASGTGEHHAHNDADCTACTARGLLSSAMVPPHCSVPSLASSSLIACASAPFSDFLKESSSRPRAPPVFPA